MSISGVRKVGSKKLLEKLVNDKGFILLDVRDPIAYRDGTLYDAPNAPLRNFYTVFGKSRKDNRKVILLGSSSDLKSLELCINYALTFPYKEDDLNLRYVLYEDV